MRHAAKALPQPRSDSTLRHWCSACTNKFLTSCPALLCSYPSQLESLLYLGDWTSAEATERHAELGIGAVVTVHNNPANLRLHPGK